jgi:hydroxyacylglutathione hydrolase
MVERILVGPMHTNAYVYSEWKKECVLIDPGADAELIIQRLTLINMKPRGVILTHGHIDHVSAAGEIKRHYTEAGLELLIAIHEYDNGFLGPFAAEAHMAVFGDAGGSGYEGLDSAISMLPKPDILVSEGDKLFDSDLTVIHTPGHSPGSICLYSESQGVLFSGDTLLFEDVGVTNLPGADNKVLLANIREKIFVLPEDTRIFPGHGPFTTLEREIRHNPHMSN